MGIVENEAGPSRPLSTRSSHPAGPSIAPTRSRSSARLASVPAAVPSRSPSPPVPFPASSRSETAHSDDEDGEGTEMEDGETAEDYELQRQRRMRENAAIMESLGISASQLTSRGGYVSQHRGPKQRRGRKNAVPVFDRSGYILTLPREGERHRIACVEIPADRKLRRRINEGEYQDCEDGAEGEERRWRFGKGLGKLAEGEEAVVGGVGPDFRWRKWRGRKRELEAEQDKLEKLIQKDTQAELPPGVSAYSLIDGPACHQCRRKSDKEKMTCRNIYPMCRAVFCESCCKRYSYFEFDPDARSFICPLCQKCCNCSNCLRKRNLAHLLEGGKGFRRSTIQLRENLGGGEGDQTIQELLDKVMEHVPLPFDRVRLVERATDVISPELPPIPIALPPPKEKGKHGKKRKSTTEETGEKKKRGRPKKAVVEGAKEMAEAAEKEKRTGLVIKLKIPRPGQPTSAAVEQIAPTDSSASGVHPRVRGPPRSVPAELEEEREGEREKMYDSDGDTIAGSSSDGEPDRRSSTSESLTPPPPSPPLPATTTTTTPNDYAPLSRPPSAAETDNPTVALPQLHPSTSSMYRPSFGGHRSAFPALTLPSASNADQTNGKVFRPPASQSNVESFTYHRANHDIGDSSSNTPKVTQSTDPTLPAYYIHSTPAVLAPPPAPLPASAPASHTKAASQWPSVQASDGHQQTRPTQSFTYNSFTYTTSRGDTTTYASHFTRSSGSSSDPTQHQHPQNRNPYSFLQPIPIPSIQALLAANTSLPSAHTTSAWVSHQSQHPPQQHQQHDHPPPYTQSPTV